MNKNKHQLDLIEWELKLSNDKIKALKHYLLEEQSTYDYLLKKRKELISQKQKETQQNTKKTVISNYSKVSINRNGKQYTVYIVEE